MAELFYSGAYSIKKNLLQRQKKGRAENIKQGVVLASAPNALYIRFFSSGAETYLFTISLGA